MVEKNGNEDDRYVPVKEDIDKAFQMDRFGNFRIVVGDKQSKWVSYQEIAALNIEDDTYIGVSKFFEGIIPTESVFKIKEADMDGDTDFYVFKVIDSDQDLVLDSEQVEDLLIENDIYSGDFTFHVRPVRDTDFFKIKIIEIEPAGSYESDKLLNKEEVTDFMIDAFPSLGSYDIFDAKGDKIN